jgi:membrane-bound metal-dependent hydrolase YbcI (DUF457 family)
MKIARNVLLVLLIYAFIAFCFALAYDAFFFKPFTFTDALLVFIKILPSIFIGGMLTAFSWAFGKFTKTNPGRFSVLLTDYLKNVFIVSVLCMAVCVIASELCAPWIHQKQVQKIRDEKKYAFYVEMARLYHQEKNYEQAVLYSKYALRINRQGPEAAELEDMISVNNVLKREKKSHIPKPAPLNAEILELGGREYNTIPELMEEAEKAFAGKRWFDAHYNASMVVSITDPADANHARAKQISAIAWNELGKTDYKYNQEQADVYALKRQGYSDLVRGENIKAYYLYRKLLQKYPADADINRYYNIAENRVSKQFFYIDETHEIEGREQYRDVYFTQKNDFGGKDVVSIKGVSLVDDSGSMYMYLRELKIFTYSQDDIFLRSLSVPYAKVSAYSSSDFGQDYFNLADEKIPDLVPVAMLESVDREHEGIMIEPVYEYTEAGNEAKMEKRSYFVFNMGYSDFLVLCHVSREADRMELGSLLRFAKNATQYGFSSEVFTQALIQRICYPIILLLMMISCAVLGWKYRITSSQMFKFKWLFVVPVFSALIYIFLEFMFYFEGLLSYLLISLIGFAALPVMCTILLLTFAVVTIRFVALRGE